MAFDRRLVILVVAILVGVSLLSIAAFALNIGILGFMPFLFLFIPIAIPLGDRGSGRRDDIDGHARFCPGCGSPVDEGYDFCTVCGRRLRREPHRDASRAERLRQSRRV